MFNLSLYKSTLQIGLLVLILGNIRGADVQTRAADIPLITTKQLMVESQPNQFHRVGTLENWDPSETALIICDVWDSHHCVNAVRRVHEIAPRIDLLAKALRAEGSVIIHAPSGCMKAYESHPGRIRATTAKKAFNLPSDIQSWCDRIPSEEQAAYPVDQSDGGEDDNPEEHSQWVETLVALGRNPKTPWIKQISTIKIDSEHDFITDSGNEVWNILESKGIKHVLMCGVHTNMCVLGRPFGLRQLSSHGKHAVLLRDLTDTMYNPLKWPYVSHFSGTDLVIDHIERYVCSTTTSDHFFRASDKFATAELLSPARFSNDKRPHLAIIAAENEYDTARTLTSFAATHLDRNLRVSLIYGDAVDPAALPGLDVIDNADALLISIRRRPLRPDDLQRIRRFVESGRPIIGIRTASHAFSLRSGSAAAGLEQWSDFDSYAFGGNYTNHYANDLYPKIFQEGKEVFTSNGSLYQVSPLKKGTRVLWTGQLEGKSEEPIAWSFVRPDGGHSFYTSLGHATDFDKPDFLMLLSNAIFNALGVEPVDKQDIVQQAENYRSGKGKQR